MTVQLSKLAIVELAKAPALVQRAFIKQLSFLVRDLNHPGIHAKKFDESEDQWQGRINGSWRFWFEIRGDVYYIIDLGPHPK